MCFSQNLPTLAQRFTLAAALTLSVVVSSYAQTPQIEVKIIGVSYLEAPPGRDKNLAAFGTFSSMEKVEVHAVATSKNAFFPENASFLEKGNITASAIATNGTSIPLGTADMNSFEKVSTDRRMRSLNVSITRLPDQAIKGIVFEGQVPVQTFKQLKTIERKIEIKAGTSFNIEKLAVNIAKLEGKMLTIKGNAELAQIASMAIKTADGKLNAAKRGSYSRMNNDVSQDWEFSSPIAPGVMVLELFDGMQEIKLPVRFVVGKPF
jgi:hypothetical protein